MASITALHPLIGPASAQPSLRQDNQAFRLQRALGTCALQQHLKGQGLKLGFAARLHMTNFGLIAVPFLSTLSGKPYCESPARHT